MSDQQPPVHYEVGDVVNGHRWSGTAWEPVEMSSTPLPPPSGPAAGLPAPAAPVDPSAAASKPLWKKWWVWVAGVVVLLVVIGAVGSSGNKGASGSGSSTSPSPTASTPAASESASQTPSDTVSPTTEAPSPSTPTDPVAAARAQFAQTFPVFGPIKASGSSDKIIKLPPNVTAALVTMTYKGSSNFIVEPLDASNQPTGDTLANEIGVWRGAAPFGLHSFGGSAAKIQVQAQGAWTLTIAPVSTAPAISFPAAGKGTGVYLYAGDVGDWTLTHTGSANFIVDEIGTDGSNNNLVNEIGRYSGQVPAAPGPALISINADGTWTIKG